MSEQKKIIDLGSKEGELLFFGGVYSNLQSLQALKNWCDERNYAADNIFCTGDILGYCAQPTECIELIKEWGVVCIAGNVELNIRNNVDDCGCDFNEGGRCDLFSKNWYAYTKSKVETVHMAWLHGLPHHVKFLYHDKQVLIVHGSWFSTSAFIFKSTDWQTKQDNFDATGADIIIAGHCGLPFADAANNKLWLNAGVIGMPANDGTNRVWFVTTYVANDKIEYTFHSYQYDHITASGLMKENGLPATYAQTLHTGIWDNCEILPQQETMQQGKPITFDRLNLISL